MQAYPMGIGEGQYVQATPIQMANVAATLADGISMHPRLVAADQAGRSWAPLLPTPPTPTASICIYPPRRSTRFKLECGKSAQWAAPDS